MIDEHSRDAIVPHGTDLPPPRPGVRYVSVPFVGIVIATDPRRRHVDRVFHWPMIILALAILPLLVIEIFWIPGEGRTTAEEILNVAVIVGFGIVWFAFLVEFVIKISIAESRLEYARRNWLDIMIIVVPVVRPLRAVRVVRATRVLKLRGAGMKVARLLFTTIIGLEATERLLLRVGLKVRTDQKHPDDMTRYELSRELKRLRKLTDRWEKWYEEQAEYMKERGDQALSVAPDAGEDADAGERADTHADPDVSTSAG